jgi:small subunit ribosomal protein S15
VLAREQKKSVIDQYGTHATDTGSPEVQIALLGQARPVRPRDFA